MLKHESIPIIDAGFAHLCASFLVESGYPVHEWLLETHLPKAVITSGEGYVSEYHLRKLMVMAVERTGREDLGLQLAKQASTEDLGSVGDGMRKAATLYDALRVFCRDVMDVNSHARFWLAQNEGKVWFCRANPDELEVGQLFAEQFTIMYMIELVRELHQRDWYPSHIWLKASSLQGYGKKPEFEKVSFSLNRGISAISLPKLEGISIDSAHKMNPTSARPPGLVATLKKLLPLYFTEMTPTLEFVAELSGFNSRTLKRRLSEENLSYRELLSQMRFELACDLLKNTNRTILDIANAVSYSHPGNFTRAFTQWSGKSPKAYRIGCNEHADSVGRKS